MLREDLPDLLNYSLPPTEADYDSLLTTTRLYRGNASAAACAWLLQIGPQRHSEISLWTSAGVSFCWGAVGSFWWPVS